MILPRVIPCLLLRDKGLVKGVNFKNHQYIGDPINAVSIFNKMEVDELLFLDIDATKQNRIPPLPLVQKIADQCLMPFGVGGGIKSISDIKMILSAGAEKICMNTFALENPDFIKKASSTFGSQSIVVSIDFKSLTSGKQEIYSRCGTKIVSKDLLSTVKFLESIGVGEIILNSIDRDGMMKGYDIKSIREVTKIAKVPVIALGGAGSIKDLKVGIEKGGASAVSAGSMFVFHGRRKAVLINYPSIKELKYIKGG